MITGAFERSWKSNGVKTMENAQKTITSALKTSWVPDLSWNLWLTSPDKDGKGGVPRPDADRVSVEIEWPTGEDFDRLTAQSSSTAIFFALTKKCAAKIERFSFRGEIVETGAELVAIRSRGAARCRELAINIGSHVFRESLLTEDEVKN
jgi:hypothetical protein